MSNYTVEQLRKRLKELRRIWSADYFFIPKDAEELLAIAGQLPAKIEECERLNGVLKYWASDGRLETFLDRERFRAEAHAALKETK